jgi:hypothetical protein
MAQRAHSRTSKSGRSRHRKPNNTVRNFGLATAPLFAAIPMANTPSASAATSAWDKLASCESGNNWSINTGNGYYGGLQFADGTWDGNGGEKFASRADLASRTEQIIIAARVLDNSGWGPWPACSSKMGLGAEERREALATAEEYRQAKNGGGATDAQPASDKSADDKAAADKKAADKKAAEEQAAAEKKKADDERAADQKKQNKADADADADKAKADGQRTEASRVSTDRASRGKHRKTASSADLYVVRRGDTLAAIARAKDVPGGWQNLYKINRDTVGGNPGLIFPGQRLSLG